MNVSCAVLLQLLVLVLILVLVLLSVSVCQCQLALSVTVRALHTHRDSVLGACFGMASLASSCCMVGAHSVSLSLLKSVEIGLLVH